MPGSLVILTGGCARPSAEQTSATSVGGESPRFITYLSEYDPLRKRTKRAGVLSENITCSLEN